MSSDQHYELAREVQAKCIQAALSAYESASVSGLCSEGAFEAAISAMRMLDVDSLVEQRRNAGALGGSD